MRKQCRLILLVSVLMPLVAQADMEAGADAFNRGDYATALAEWRPLAQQGHAAAQYNLGAMYLNGQGVPQDDAEAVKLFRRSAEQGYAMGQYYLGYMYLNGQGVPQDYVAAYAWFNVAAAQGSKAAPMMRVIAAGRMTPAQMAEAQKLSREIFERTVGQK